MQARLGRGRARVDRRDLEAALAGGERETGLRATLLAGTRAPRRARRERGREHQPHRPRVCHAASTRLRSPARVPPFSITPWATRRRPPSVVWTAIPRPPPASDRP